MHDATGEGQLRVWFGMRPFTLRSKVGVEVALVFGLTSLGTACEPGELSDRQQQYLRDQLDEQYTGTPSPAGTASPGESTSEADGPITSETNGDSSSSSGVGTVPDTQGGSDTPTSSDTQSVTSEPTAGTVPACALDVFHTTCSGGVCHYQGAINLPPDFETDDLYTMLTTTKSVVCTSAPSYIDLENPQNSLLLLKVTGAQPGSCGAVMPPTPATLTAAQLTCLEDWIGSL